MNTMAGSIILVFAKRFFSECGREFFGVRGSDHPIAGQRVVGIFFLFGDGCYFCDGRGRRGMENCYCSKVLLNS